jgi:hypothetical protein
MNGNKAVLAKRPTPYSMNHNGHAVICDCDVCATLRAVGVIKLWKAHGSQAELDPSKTIFVRSHFRRGKHWVEYPASKRALRDAIQKFAADQHVEKHAKIGVRR